jgi:transposase
MCLKSGATAPSFRSSVASRNHTHDGVNLPIARIAAPYPCKPAFSLGSATLTPIETRNQLFVLSHLSRGRRGPAPTLALHTIFNYILQLLYTVCQWSALPIKMNAKGRPEIHYTRIYRILRRWQADGCIDRIFAGAARKLHVDGRLDLSVIHGEGTITAAKKGGDNLGCC